MTASNRELPAVLVCVECSRRCDASDDSRGWRAYLDDDDEVVVFCPDCAEREFRSS